MTQTIRTLLIDSAMSHPKCRRGTVSDNIPKWMRSWPLVQKYFYLPIRPSYVQDWKDAFYLNADLDIEVCSISNLMEYPRFLKRLNEYDLIVVLHNATYTHIHKLIQTAGSFGERQGKLAVFFANEYEEIGEKIDFVNLSGADYLCSQLPLEIAQWFYEECNQAKLVATPHALNEKLYRADTSIPRDLDVGFMGMLYHTLIGDRERSDLIEWFQTYGEEKGLRCEFHMKSQQRQNWVAFLNRCKAIVGAESGTYYLDRHGASVMKAKAIIDQEPDVSFEDVYERVYKNLTEVKSGKAISSRHFEAIGMKACQILVEGEYNGILKENQHYISVKKDLSNVDDAIERFKDETYRNQIVDRAYEYVLANHTYEKRVADFVKRIKN